MATTHIPTPDQILRVMQHPERSTAPLLNDAWRAIDVARALSLPGGAWKEVELILADMARWGQIAQVPIKRTQVPRYRLLGG